MKISKKRIRIYPYSLKSKSARMLKRELINRGYNVLLVKPDGRYMPDKKDLIINWGMSRIPNWYSEDLSIVNNPRSIRRASNKLNAFKLLSNGGVSIPNYTTDLEVAQDWWEKDTRFLGRSLLSSHSGRGIFVSDTASNPDNRGGMDAIRMSEIFYGFKGRRRSLPLYTEYINGDSEYRVHIFNGKVIDIQEKRGKRGVKSDMVVKSYKNGWVFCREDLEYNEKVINEGIAAIKILDINFGAMDIIWSNDRDNAYILEVNTAPGLVGSTVISYSDEIESILKQK